MALQDLTPQLRTRLTRMERLVGLFIAVATILLLVGLGYYIYDVAQRKGWFLNKAPYFTYVDSATGLKVGDKVRLMGFDVGVITRITAEAPGMPYNVYIEFHVYEPFYGYIWTDSRVKVTADGLLGGRVLEITKGGASGSASLHATYKETDGELAEVWADKEGVYTNIAKGSVPYWLLSEESPAITKQIEKVADQIDKALPNIFSLTNQLAVVLTNFNQAAQSLDVVMTEARPAITNLAQITEQLRDPKGSLGEWLLPTNLHLQLLTTLESANTTLTNTDANLTSIATGLDTTLENLANITSNLNAQVQANTNILGEISSAVVHSDELVQGLKRHWFLRSAFREKKEKDSDTNSAPLRPIPTRGGRLNP